MAKKNTYKKAATKASSVLKNDPSSKAAKSSAGSALTQFSSKDRVSSVATNVISKASLRANTLNDLNYHETINVKKKTQHVVRSSSGGWAVKKGGSEKSSRRFITQEEAIDWGREVAKNQRAEFYIHDEDGKIKSKNSYRNISNLLKDKSKNE